MDQEKPTPNSSESQPTYGGGYPRGHLEAPKPDSAQDQNQPYANNQQSQQPAFDWQQYHTAWQQYYQQYYHRYYQHILAQQQSAKEDEAKPAAPELPGHIIVGSDNLSGPKSRAEQLREDLLASIRERANKFKKGNHFWPIASALIVILLFLLLQFNRTIIAGVESFISPGSTVDVSNTFIVDPTASANVGPEPKLIIPKININVPVIYNVANVDNRQIQSALEKGVVRYNLPGANSLPGQNGNMVILGHSSNDVFDPGDYKFAFLLLNRLKNGDVFYINYQSKRYVYKVNDTKVVKPSDWKVLLQDKSKPTVILVTPTPAGTALERLLVYGEQISPDPAAASAKPSTGQEANPAEIPGNSPTFFERLGDIFF